MADGDRGFAAAGHLPHLDDGTPSDPRGLPRQRRGTTPQMHGRYPDYDVLANARNWDAVTRERILARVRDVPPLRFFTAPEAACLRAFLDVVLAQDDEPRVPVLELVDEKLHAGRLDGYRYDDMPDDRDTWRLVAAALDAAAQAHVTTSFAQASLRAQRELVDGFAHGELAGGPAGALNVTRAWSVVMRGALSAFYSHPWAWNEIGFSGPAYPRGAMRLGAGIRGAEPTDGVEAFGPDPVPDVRARGLE